MRYDPQKYGHAMPCPYHRRSIRLPGYDYSQLGAYFVTICTQERTCLFGKVVDGVMRLNELGEIVRRCWLEIPRHFLHVELDAFVVMPNHVHGIIVLVDSVGATHASPLPITNASPLPITNASSLPITNASSPPITNASSPLAQPRGPQRQSLSSIVGSFKSAVTKRINQRRATPGAPVWQRNYYEHIIGNEHALHRIRQYIAENIEVVEAGQHRSKGVVGSARPSPNKNFRRSAIRWPACWPFRCPDRPSHGWTPHPCSQ